MSFMRYTLFVTGVMVVSMLWPLTARAVLIDFSPDTVGGATGTSFFNEIGVQVIADRFTLAQDAVLTGASIYSQSHFPTDGVGTDVQFRIYAGTITGPTLGADPIIDIPTQIDVIDEQGATSLSPANPHTRKHASIPDTPLSAGTYWFAMPSPMGGSDVRQSGVTTNPYDDSTLARGTDQLTVIDGIGDMWFQIEGRFVPDDGGGDPGGGDPGGGDPGGGDPGGGDNPVVPTTRTRPFPSASQPGGKYPIGAGVEAEARYQDQADAPDVVPQSPGLQGLSAAEVEAVAPDTTMLFSTNNQSFARSQALGGVPFSFFTQDSPVVTVKSEAFSGPSQAVAGQLLAGADAVSRSHAIDLYEVGSSVQGVLNDQIMDIDLDLRLAIGGTLRFTGEPDEGFAEVRIIAAYQSPELRLAQQGLELFEAVARWDGQNLDLTNSRPGGTSDWADASYDSVITTQGDTVEILFELIFEDLDILDGGDVVALSLFIESSTYVAEATNAIAHVDFFQTVVGGVSSDHPDAGFRVITASAIPAPTTAVLCVIGMSLFGRRRPRAA